MNLMEKNRKGTTEQILKDGSKISIRAYNQEDLPFIHEIEELCFLKDERYSDQHLEMLGEFQNYCFLVAVQKSRIIGYTIGVIRSTKEGPMGHIISVAVHPHYRRIGIGMSLVKNLMAQLKHVGASYFRLEAKMTNKAARSMYRKLGFNYEFVLRNYYGSGKDAVVMKMWF